jgi:hypothetical protein
VPQDVRRAPVSDPGRDGKSPDELLDGSSRQGHAATSNEQRRRCVDPAARGQPGSKRPSAPAADGHHPLARSLAANEAAPFDKIKVTEADPDQLAEADTGVKEQRDDRLVSERVLRTRRSREEGAHLRVPERRDEDVRHLRGDEPIQGLDR